ncbi:MAG TPA: serine hydrolase [Niabella sp.]
MQRIRIMKSACMIGLLFISLTNCSKNDIKNPARQDGFETGSFKEAGIDEASIINLEKEIQAGKYNIHSVLILKGNKLIYEHYFPGDDAVFPDPVGVIDHNRDSLHDCRSLTKSLVSACVGIAMEQGRIHSLEDKIFNYFPAYIKYATGKRATITIRDLLTMSAGFEWNENTPYTDTLNDEINMSVKPDVVDYVLSKPMVHTPGTVWNYSGGCTQLLAELIKNATGLRVDSFAKTYLFGPLGITKYNWYVRPSLTPEGGEVVWAPSGLRMRSIDLAKIGTLYLNNGIYNGNAILSEKWVEQSLHWQINTDGVSEGYGFQFWCTQPLIAKGYTNVAMADGNGGQRICMIPSKSVIIVLTAGNYDEAGSISDDLLTNVFFPAIH